MTDRELDALVAEKVMGWQKVPTTNEYDEPDGDWCWVAPHGSTRGKTCHPAFSTDIAAAWEVVEKVYESGHGWILVRPTKDNRYVAYEATGCGDPDFGDYCEYADTAPKAICLAALKAKGVDIDS